MHRVRNSVRENRLSDPHRINERSYLPYVAAGSAWIAETDAALLGFAALDAQSRRVWALFVDPKAEGTGVGRALHRRMLEWARQTGIRDLSLSTENGTRAVEFYKSAGWIESGVTADGELLFELTLDA
jgi:GNAT superfamily N-acetyltransferase